MEPIADAGDQACDAFISPHSGFGMAALAVGTPWLTQAPRSYFERFLKLHGGDRSTIYTIDK